MCFCQSTLLNLFILRNNDLIYVIAIGSQKEMCGSRKYQSKNGWFCYFLFNMGNDTDKMEMGCN